ncbi:MAG: sensor histidine kinase [Spirochaetales bacterium]
MGDKPRPRASIAGARERRHQKSLSWLHSRLERRLIAALVAIIVVTMAGFAILDYRVTRDDVLEDLAARSEQAVTRLKYSLDNLLWSYDEETASAYLRGEMQDENLVAIVVDDLEEDEIWLAYARVGDNSAPEQVERRNSLETAISDAYGSRTRRISHEGEEIGQVTVYFRDDAAREEIRSRLATTGSVTVALGVLVAIVVALVQHRMIVSPLRSVLRRLDRVAAGDYEAFSGSHRSDDIGVITAGLERMVSTIAEREASLRASAEEKEVMLREIHHRVKNNFQILSSLLSLQKRDVSPEAVPALENSEHRIRSMEMVHEKLYESPTLAHIRAAGYIAELVDLLRRSHGIEASRVTVEAEDCDIPLDIAVPLGIIINEAVSNACKHAFADSEEARVSVRFQLSDHVATFVVRDTGPGLSDSLFEGSDERLGFRLVAALAEQIDGTLELVSENGARVAVTFPLPGGAQDTPGG